MTENTAIVELDKVEQALADCRTVEEVLDLRHKASALKQYAKLANLGLDMQNSAAKAKIRCERRAGELLLDMEKNKGGRPPKTWDNVSRVSPPSYAERGIRRKQATRFQVEAKVPELIVLEYEARKEAAREEISTAGLLRYDKKLRQAEEQAQTAANQLQMGPDDRRYRTIVIDPPWPIQKPIRDVRPRQDVMDYATMTLEEIAMLPIKTLALPDGCHIYLWVTHKYLPAGLNLFKTWKVKYQCVMTWIKPSGFTPFSWMYNTEHVLFGSIGNLPLDRMGTKLSFAAPTSGHSRKPDAFFQTVKEASPEPRINLFAREERPGFFAWGKEASG